MQFIILRKNWRIFEMFINTNQFRLQIVGNHIQQSQN